MVASVVCGEAWVVSTVVVEDVIYGANNDGILYALDVATGKQLWSLPLSHSLWGAPVTNGSMIFISSLDHFLYAVDSQAQKIVWKTDLGGSVPGAPSISQDGGTLYVGSFAKKVFAVDAETGAIRWAADTNDWIWGSPILDGDTVFAADISGNLYSLGAPNGKDAWPEVQPDGPITGSPLAIPDGVLVATESGSVFAFDPTGSKLWDASVGGKIYSAPVASGDLVLVAPLNSDFLLAALGKDGKLLWNFTGK